MRDDKDRAVRYRLAGKSYTEIQKLLGGISKSTLSLWLKDLTLSHNARDALKKKASSSMRLLLKRNYAQTVEAVARRCDIHTSAAREVQSIDRRSLFFVGLALYWAEGHKRLIVKNGREVTYHPVSLTNSDSALVCMFLRFLREICHVPIIRIKASLRIFEHMDEKLVMDYWVAATGIPVSNFTKTYVGVSKSSQGKRPFNRLPYGVIQIRINDTKLFHKIMGWISGMKKFVN